MQSCGGSFFSHLPLGDAETEPGVVEVPEPIDQAQFLERRDVQRELFARLREQAGPELRPVIDYWEPNYLADDCIARGEFDRRLVHRVRLLARAILADLAREIQPRAHRNGNADVNRRSGNCPKKDRNSFPDNSPARQLI